MFCHPLEVVSAPNSVHGKNHVIDGNQPINHRQRTWPVYVHSYPPVRGVILNYALLN